MLVALPAGGRGGDKFDAGAAAPEAPAAAIAEAGAAQAVTTIGREGVTAAPAEAQASTANTAATSVATGDGGGDHSCRKRGDVVRTKGRREHLGHRGQLPEIHGVGTGGLPLSSFPPTL